MRKVAATKRLSTTTSYSGYLRVEMSLILQTLCSNLIVFESLNFSSDRQFSTVLEKAPANESSNTRCHLCGEDSYDAERR